MMFFFAKHFQKSLVVLNYVHKIMGFEFEDHCSLGLYPSNIPGQNRQLMVGS